MIAWAKIIWQSGLAYSIRIVLNDGRTLATGTSSPERDVGMSFCIAAQEVRHTQKDAWSGLFCKAAKFRFSATMSLASLLNFWTDVIRPVMINGVVAALRHTMLFKARHEGC